VSASDPALLIVDDNEDNRYTLSRRLARYGYKRLTTASNGREALQLLQTQPFDLVLLDIMMPEMNGYEVLERLKASAELRQLPVIMISAVDEMDSAIRCIELGAEDYLAKPFNPTCCAPVSVPASRRSGCATNCVPACGACNRSSTRRERSSWACCRRFSRRARPSGQ
jgi:CheY-like chemotaxis protein